MDTLTEKKYKDRNRLSRYSTSANYYNKLDKKYESSIPKELDKTTRYSLYIVRDNESYDLISLKAYNNPTYYWIICDFNNILDPFSIPSIGTRLRIPIFSDIKFKD